MISDLLYRMRALLRRNRMEAELDEELRAHIEHQVEKHVLSGLPLQEAVRRARLEFGGLDQVKEECRHARGLNFIETMIQDARYALRSFRKSPLFTAVAVFTLALGIGANTAIFQILDVIVLKPLAVRDPQELVRLQGYQNGHRQAFTYPLLREMSKRQRTLDGIFASEGFPIREVRLGGRKLDKWNQAWAVTGNYFRLIGTDPQVGRFFTDADDAPESPPVAVISDRLWRSEFGGQQSVQGSTIHLNGTAVAIVGVTRPEFFGDRVGIAADLWVPLHLIAPLSSPIYVTRSVSWLQPMARLRTGIPVEQVRAEISLLWTQLTKEFGMQILGSSGCHLEIEPAPNGIGNLHTQFSRPLWLLMAIVGLVALISCCNLANLLLARATARSPEMSVRFALGAGRMRLIRQLATESLALSALGGGVGLGIAALASNRLVALASAGETWKISTAVDWRIACFALIVTLASAMLSGLVPAISSTRAGLNANLQTGRRAQTGGCSRQVFVVAQVALSLLLVAGASLLVRSFWKLTHQDFGFRPEGVLIANLSADISGFKELMDANTHRAIVERLRDVPGIRAASSAVAGPLGNVTEDATIALPERTLPVGSINTVLAAPGYFEAMGIPIFAGRPIIDADRKDAPKVAVISESAARRMFGTRNAVGRFFSEGEEFDRRKEVQVVGVIGDLRYSSPRAPFGPLVFYPVAQSSIFSFPTLVLRTEGNPLDFAGAVRAAVREVAPTLRVAESRTLVSMLETASRRERLLAWLSGAFGSLALILAAVGLYGVVAYVAQQRTPEMGIRLALGARPFQVRVLLMREVAWLLAVGLAFGGGATIALTRWLESLLFELTPLDPATLAAATALLGTVALAGAYLPARRASWLDPVTALRAE